jgi:hypothetical protein
MPEQLQEIYLILKIKPYEECSVDLSELEDVEIASALKERLEELIKEKSKKPQNIFNLVEEIQIDWDLTN